MSMIAIVEQAANGVIIGSFYALTAIGLSIIFGVLKIVNFAHGELYMIGGYVGWSGAALLGLPPSLAVLLAILALFAFGALLERALITPINRGKVDRPDEYAIMITFALAVFLQALFLAVLGPWPKRPDAILSGRIEIGELIIPGGRLSAAAASVLIILAAFYVLRATRWGRAIRATAQDRQGAAALGVPVERVGMAAFGLGAALAGAAGALIGPVFNVTPTMGVIPVIKAYVVVVLGGLGSIPGAILGALALAQIEVFATVLIPDTTRALAYKDAYGLVVLILVLLLRPHGLFGERERRA